MNEKEIQEGMKTRKFGHNLEECKTINEYIKYIYDKDVGICSSITKRSNVFLVIDIVLLILNILFLSHDAGIILFAPAESADKTVIHYVMHIIAILICIICIHLNNVSYNSYKCAACDPLSIINYVYSIDRQANEEEKLISFYNSISYNMYNNILKDITILRTKSYYINMVQYFTCAVCCLFIICIF